MKLYLRNNFQEFLLYQSNKCFLHEVAFDLHLPQEHQGIFPILLLPSSESDDSFPGQLSFRDSFETIFSHVKFVLSFLSLLDILYKKALSIIFFFERHVVNDQK